MSDLLKAWYIFLGLSLLSLISMAFIGKVPTQLSNLIALPHQLLFQVGSNLRSTAESAIERHDYLSEIDSLEKDVAELQTLNRQLELQIKRYQQVLRVRELQSPSAKMTASVTGIDSSSLLSRLSLSAGSIEGVVKHMPVTVPEGLVGIVSDVTNHSSIVRTIIDPESRVGVTVRNKGGQGIAVGEIDNRVRVIAYSKDGTVNLGDLVETQSRGGLFPRGILVGEVVEIVLKDPNDLQIEFLVRPAADIHNVLEVALIEPL